MATGRTLSKWARIYGNGYDLSGHARSIGTLPWEFESPDLFTMTDPIHNHLLGQSTIGPLSFNMILDTTAVSGSHTLLSANNALWDLMIPIGIRADPAMGDPVYMGKFPQKKYVSEEDAGVITASVDFGIWDAGDRTIYKKPWGNLVAPWADYSAPNAGLGYDDLGGAGPTLFGGYMMYQIFAFTVAGTVAISLQHSTDNVALNFTELATPLTTGALATGTFPTAGIVECGRTESIKRFIRYQIALAGGTTHCWMALAFVRGTAGLY